MSAVTDSAVNPDWMRVAQTFSDADLQAPPDTERAMACLSDDVVFSEPGRYDDVGKRTVWVSFKTLGRGVLEYDNTRDPEFKQEGNHIVWKFWSLQLRKYYPSEWLFGAQWYRIDNTVRLFFTGEGDNCKISKYETIHNEWTPITEEEARSSINQPKRQET